MSLPPQMIHFLVYVLAPTLAAAAVDLAATCATLPHDGVLHVPASVTRIPSKAFDRCAALKRIEFAPNSQLTHIDDQAFASSGIEHDRADPLQIPASVTAIGPFAFLGCKKLEKLQFASSSLLARIGKHAFYSTGLDCESVEEALDQIASRLPSNTWTSRYPCVQPE
uniref:Uncharacterized protein n=1 Tax=Calcidiscus leptoporus TaxID=127549 RepID=A0A7S0P3Q9_9EUKA